VLHRDLHKGEWRPGPGRWWHRLGCCAHGARHGGGILRHGGKMGEMGKGTGGGTRVGLVTLVPSSCICHCNLRFTDTLLK
jgi:hypothetical protein